MLGDLIKSMIGPIVGPLIDRIPDPNERARAKEQIEAQMLAAMTSLVQGQLEINKQEAQHKSLFVAGWRPSVGWVCSLALAWNFIFQPLLSWVFFSYGLDLQDAPTLDTGELTTILLGMLGLGGLRTYEKRLNVASDNMGKKK
jgi:hypothetical protein